ncbi:cytochrome c1-2, heme protein, mitochondrial-like [Triticum dicoccoides]|uniref:cytochrome c1-2, heme protein, mitochondrial-like n=1 Tax=Triticum dicoccoides TaxID=85692 RepID=UPI001891BEAB|nr:cytochrome c1-2, heme protein, mitochondrial-like [Triticum dicoccoides]
MASPGASCPAAYSWAPQDGAQRGQTVFMQVCAGCHVMLPYAGLRAAAQGEVGAQTAEIMVAEEAVTAARPPSGGSYTPDLTALTTKIHEGAALYTTGGKIMTTMLTGGVSMCQELTKMMAPPSAMWMQFAQPYIGTIQMA